MKNPFKKAAFQPVLVVMFLCVAASTLLAGTSISGQVIDEQRKPIVFATVSLMNKADSSFVKGEVCTETGHFVFSDVDAGSYYCTITMLGYETISSQAFSVSGSPVVLAPISLQSQAATLDEVTVTERRPLVEQKIDRLIVNVANTISVAGGNALQVLQRSPGIQVNALTKSISMMGKQGVIVMINDKITRLSMDAVVDMLSGMNADNIDRIELIHTPPANFEAEGNAGVINIVLKKSIDEGLNGGYSLNAGYGRGLKYGGGMYFNARKKAFNVFGNYDLNYNLNPQVFTNYRRVQQGSDYLETDTYSNRPHTPTTTQNARLGLDWQASPKTSVGVLGTFFDRNWYMEAENKTRYSKNGQLDSLLRMPNTETNHARSFAGNINLTHQFSANQRLTMDADLVQYDINNPSTYNLENRDNTDKVISEKGLRINKETPVDILVAKADYFVKLGEKTNLETGVKYTNMQFDNDVRVEDWEPGQEWQVIPMFTSFFQLDEQIMGAYTTLSTSWGSKTDIKAGLRYEYTDTYLGSADQPGVVDREYGSWFPSLFITNRIAENRTINLSYSRRISRPTIRTLAPWLIFSDPTTIEGGNPAVQPSFTNAFSVSYNQKAWNLAVSYSIEDEPMRFVPRVDKVNNRQFNSFDNIGQERVASANLSFPWKPAPWWETRQNIFSSYNLILFDLEGESFELENFNYGFSSNQTFTLPRSWTLEVVGTYNSPGYWGIAYWKATGSLDIGLEKNLGPTWGRLRLAASDLFMSGNWFGETNQPAIGLNVRSSYQFSERVVKLSWTNTFGNQKVKAARQRQTASSEEMRRL